MGKIALAVLLFALAALPAQAARPLLDSGKWDNYFALFAREGSVPWKPITLRLDTYSGAAVDFAAYDVDPTDVLVAGANARPRAIDTSHRTPVARWRFTPQPGLTFESNDVAVPLQNREGFFVVEARRGNAVQQVWINLTRIGLLTKESPGGSFVYGADLGTGRAFRGMRVTYLVGMSFVYALTDAHGMARVPARARFALAEWGASKAFVSFLPQSPPAGAVVAVRAERSSIRAGESLHVVGFARKRNGNVYKPASGPVNVALLAGGRRLAESTATLDAAGAFTTTLDVPADTAAGDVAILATAGGASGGTTVHVDSTGTIALGVQAGCSNACPPALPIPLTIGAKRAGVPVPNAPITVRIVRTPHVLAPDHPADAPVWGTTPVVDVTLRTDALGFAHVAIPAPSDGLPSTYGITVSSGASTATSSLVAPDAKVALFVQPLDDAIDPSDPATIDVRGFDALDGSPAVGLSVDVQIAHGPQTQQQTVVLDARGGGRVTFQNVALGMNLVAASADVDGRKALDVAAVTVAPSAISASADANGGDVHITLDRARYHPGDRVAVSATLGGASGDALVTMESMRGAAGTVVPVQNGTAGATLTVPDTLGAVQIGVAFVRDGTLVTGNAPVVVDGPGHQRQLTLTTERASYAPGSVATIAVADGGDATPATLAVRVSDRPAGAGASFDDVPVVMATDGTTTQNLASSDPPWHAWVAPAGSTASDLYESGATSQGAPVETPAVANARVYSWSVDRSDRSTFEVTLPKEPGRYVIAIVKMTDDGDVGAGSIAVTVQ